MTQPHGVDLYETMAMTLAELGQYDQAIQWQRGAIDAQKVDDLNSCLRQGIVEGLQHLAVVEKYVP